MEDFWEGDTDLGVGREMAVVGVLSWGWAEPGNGLAWSITRGLEAARVYGGLRRERKWEMEISNSDEMSVFWLFQFFLVVKSCDPS